MMKSTGHSGATPESVTSTDESSTLKLRSVIRDFLVLIDYQTPSTTPRERIEGVETAIIEEAKSIGLQHDDGAVLQAIFEAAVAASVCFYPLHSPDLQAHIGLFTWLLFIVDDNVLVPQADLVQFPSRFSSDEWHPCRLLDSLAKAMRAMHKYYDPIIANWITLSALSYINTSALEGRREYQTMSPGKEAINWPYYFREKEGIADAYAYLCFPEATYPDISCFLPAIPDMNIFINLTNDILSFYKEEKASEDKNYIRKRATCENRESLQVLQSLVSESSEASGRSQAVLQNKHPYAEVWHAFRMGYTAMHIKTRRYRLSELDVDARHMENM